MNQKKRLKSAIPIGASCEVSNQPGNEATNLKGKIVLVGGTFEIIHPGHIFFLNRAKGFGDTLVVVVARDSTVKRLKRMPVIPEYQRLEVVQSLKPVDIAVLGNENEEIIEIVKDIKPEIIALGPNQMHDDAELESKLRENGLMTIVKRVTKLKRKPLHSTKQIIDKIRE